MNHEALALLAGTTVDAHDDYYDRLGVDGDALRTVARRAGADGLPDWFYEAEPSDDTPEAVGAALEQAAAVTAHLAGWYLMASASQPNGGPVDA